MNEQIEYIGLLILAALVLGVLAGVTLIIWAANRFLGIRKPNAVKTQPFECGVDPVALPAGRLPIHFYVMAMLFVVFDVELVFLLPWAVVLKELGWVGLVDMALFLVIVIAGFIYAWTHGALEWER